MRDGKTEFVLNEPALGNFIRDFLRGVQSFAENCVGCSHKADPAVIETAVQDSFCPEGGFGMDRLVAVQHVKIHIQISFVPEFQHSDRPVLRVKIDDNVLAFLLLHLKALIADRLNFRIQKV